MSYHVMICHHTISFDTNIKTEQEMEINTRLYYLEDFGTSNLTVKSLDIKGQLHGFYPEVQKL